MKRMILTLAIAGALMLAGCGGGSKTATMSGGPAVGGGGGTPTPTPTPTPGGGSGGGGTPTPTSVAIEGLPTVHTLETGTIPAGQSRTVGEVGGVTTLVRCSGSEDCSIRVAANRAASLLAGSLRVETQGPAITSGTIPLSVFHALNTGTIPAGQARTVRAGYDMTTLVRCSGSEDCNVMVADGVATLLAGSLRVETQRERIALVAPTPIPGVGTPGGGTVSTTWEQLPSLVDRMDYEESVNKEEYPVPLQCRSLTDCQSVAKSLLAAATDWTGTRRRFEGTRTLQTAGGVSFIEAFWGGWLDNSIFIIRNASIELDPETGEPRESRRPWHPREQIRFSMGIRDANPVTGTYRGGAVDREGNWGTSELTYTGGATGGQLGLTINIPVWPVMRWSNVPVDDRGIFRSGGPSLGEENPPTVGPKRLKGSFYQGGEVGGTFQYRRVLENVRNHGIFGVFGAKRTP